MSELILKVVLTHLLGDFVFQSNKMVAQIAMHKLRSKYLYFHILVHAFLLLLLTQFQSEYIIPILILSLSHFFIDVGTKIVLQNKINKLWGFCLDQSLHALTLTLFVFYFYPFQLDWGMWFNNQTALLALTLVSLGSVSSVLIKKMMDSFDYEVPNTGLINAGKYIGILERLFIFTFICLNFWEGIGFLLAAKSIFRFGDLKQNKEIKLTEYILIGTLLSFGLAIGISLAYGYFKIKIGL